MKRECSNCGQILSEENILLAINDSGAHPEGEEWIEEHMGFCCPTYSDGDGCKGYAAADREIAAYWMIK